MKSLICLIVLIGSLGAGAAQDLRGAWTGRIYQGAAGAFELELRIQSRTPEGYEGTAYCKSLWGPYPGRVMYRFRMQESEGAYLYEDIEVLREEKKDSFFWCMKKGRLTLLSTADSWSLSGAWEAEGCVSGTLYASKPIEAPDSSAQALPLSLENRIVEARHEFAIAADSITISIWDNNEVDGDIVSLHVNGKWVLRHYELTHEHKQLRFAHDPKGTLIILHAENLGRIPPNTAAISIHDGERFRSVVLNADEKRSEAIRIVWE